MLIYIMSNRDDEIIRTNIMRALCENQRNNINLAELNLDEVIRPGEAIGAFERGYAASRLEILQNEFGFFTFNDPIIRLTQRGRQNCS